MLAEEMALYPELTYLIGGEAMEVQKATIRKNKVHVVMLNYYTNSYESFVFNSKDEVVVRDDN